MSYGIVAFSGVWCVYMLMYKIEYNLPGLKTVANAAYLNRKTETHISSLSVYHGCSTVLFINPYCIRFMNAIVQQFFKSFAGCV
jgi:hypothetical protein